MSSNLPVGSHALLLTACIAPKPAIASLLKRADPTTRLHDYLAALRSWFQLRDPRIGAVIFAENSGHPLDKLKAMAAQEAPAGITVEFHSFDFAAPSPSMSYGHPEIQLVNAALSASSAASRLPYFIKVTGRYQYPDLPRLLDRLPAGYKVAVDTTGVRPWPWHAQSNPFCSFGLALFQTEFYRHHLWSLPDLMRPAPPWNRLQFVETMLYDRLIAHRHEPGVILRWPCNCEPVGIGANGSDYRGSRRRLIAALRAANRMLLPSVWL